MGLAWAPAKAGHPHRRACAVLLGSLGGGCPKAPQGGSTNELRISSPEYSH